MTVSAHQATADSREGLSFLWLEITGKCQLSCAHCYADSGPAGSHGVMGGRDWRRVIDEAAAFGVGMVQFIGGEPTLHPDLPGLIGHALGCGLEVEVFSNLVHVRPGLWDVFASPGVRLATSYYSDQAGQHEAVTGRRGSHARTRANIAEAVRRGIPIRAGIIDLSDGQRVEKARRELADLGVAEIGTDSLRQVGRGAREATPDVAQLCGGCADGVLAIGPDGSVWPCVFSRWMPVGNVREQPLDAIVSGPSVAATRAELAEHFRRRQASRKSHVYDSDQCRPDQPCRPECEPHCDPRCDPRCGPSCSPACRPTSHPAGPCRPRGGCGPNYRG